MLSRLLLLKRILISVVGAQNNSFYLAFSVFFRSFSEKIFHALASAFFNFANKTKKLRAVLVCVFRLLYIYASNKKKGLHKYNRQEPPPAWFSKRFVDKVNKRYLLNLNGFIASTHLLIQLF